MFRGGKFSSKERQLINQFVAITSTSERQAAEALKRNGWQLEPSLESYFNHVGSGSGIRAIPTPGGEPPAEFPSPSTLAASHV